MTTRDFVYWLRGFMERSGSNVLSVEQVAEVRRHLDLVFGTDVGAAPDDPAAEVARMLDEWKRSPFGLYAPSWPGGPIVAPGEVTHREVETGVVPVVPPSSVTGSVRGGRLVCSPGAAGRTISMGVTA